MSCYLTASSAVLTSQMILYPVFPREFLVEGQAHKMLHQKGVLWTSCLKNAFSPKISLYLSHPFRLIYYDMFLQNSSSRHIVVC